MAATFAHNQWKPEEPGGTREIPPQRQMPLLTPVGAPQRFRMLPPAVLTGASFSHTLQHAALHSCLDQAHLAHELGISKSYMTKFLSGVCERWAVLLVRFMTEACCLGPLQWMAAQVGCELVQSDARAAEVAELRQRLRELERAA